MMMRVLPDPGSRSSLNTSNSKRKESPRDKIPKLLQLNNEGEIAFRTFGSMHKVERTRVLKSIPQRSYRNVPNYYISGCLQ